MGDCSAPPTESAMKSSLRVLLLSVLLVSPMAAAQAPATVQDPEAFIADYAGKHRFNGTVLVKQRGEVVYSHSFGDANMALAVPNTRQTRYRIASITKHFT